MADQIRQGDILLIEVDISPPDNLIPQNEVILAEGEVTGHTHKLLGRNIIEWGVKEQRYIRIEDDDMGKINHEDHDPIPASVVLPKRTYQVIVQREWNLEDQWRKVQD